MCVRLWESLFEALSEAVSNYCVNDDKSGPAEIVESE